MTITPDNARALETTFLVLALIPFSLLVLDSFRRVRQRGSREDRTFLRRAYAVSAN